MERLSDRVAAIVQKAIRDLEIPEAVRGTIEWEVFPFLGLNPRTRVTGAAYMIGIGLPVPVTGDDVMPLHPLEDAHDDAEIVRVVRALFAQAELQAAEMQQQAVAAIGGLKNGQPPRLIIP